MPITSDAPAAAYVYIVRCQDGSLYTGWTTDVARRVACHNAGKGARYTRARRPVRLVYAEAFFAKEEAMSREWHIKQLNRKDKELLIASADCQEIAALMAGSGSGRKSD